VLFSLVNLGGLALTTFVVWSASGGIGPIPAKLCATVLGFGWNYSLSHAVVFRPAV
jgi:putative flippase GtrA